MKRYIIAVLSYLLLLPFPVNSQINSAIREDSIKSNVLGVTRQYTVYFPKSYTRSGEKKYPVLYLLHGHSHRNNDWTKDGRLKETADGLMSLPEQERPNTMEPEYAEFGRSILTNDCIALIKHTDKTTLEKLHSIRWFVDCGDDDFLLDVNTRFHREMKRAGVPCELRIRDGNHDWKYWQSSLCMALPFISEAFRKNPPTDK